jgi:hypothetical protein
VPRRKLPIEDDPRDEPTYTAQPHERRPEEDEDGDRLVPRTNVGGAAPTEHGLDSGGDLPGPEDDLTSLIEPEPPSAPEVGAVHVRDEDDEPKPARRTRRR